MRPKSCIRQSLRRAEIEGSPRSGRDLLRGRTRPSTRLHPTRWHPIRHRLDSTTGSTPAWCLIPRRADCPQTPWQGPVPRASAPPSRSTCTGTRSASWPAATRPPRPHRGGSASASPLDSSSSRIAALFAGVYRLWSPPRPSPPPSPFRGAGRRARHPFTAPENEEGLPVSGIPVHRRGCREVRPKVHGG